MFETLRAQKQLIKGALLSRAAVPILSLFLFNGVSAKTLEIARNIYYAALVRKVARRIRSASIAPEPTVIPGGDASDVLRKVVWVYWDTGVETAPPIVRLCANRLKAYDGIELVFLDDGNLASYAQLPAHVLRKFADGRISRAHFSDLLRLELLYTHGGIWLDATVFLTGDNFPAELLGKDLFFYAMSKPSSNGNPIYLSSWAISSPPGSPVLSIARAYLFDYWRTHDRLLDYFLLHISLCATMDEYPKLAPERLGFHNNASPHLLLLNYRTPYSPDLYDEITSISNVHKLSYKYDAVEQGSVLEHLLGSRGTTLSGDRDDPP